MVKAELVEDLGLKDETPEGLCEKDALPDGFRRRDGLGHDLLPSMSDSLAAGSPSDVLTDPAVRDELRIRCSRLGAREEFAAGDTQGAVARVC
mmetsp:Transcript_6632/g.11289  ORF Transcript_6632/g.11289 Transcript_6632/m.11289 type:complete len:93 (-) Transcript_6632:1099-1377(-)